MTDPKENFFLTRNDKNNAEDWSSMEQDQINKNKNLSKETSISLSESLPVSSKPYLKMKVRELSSKSHVPRAPEGVQENDKKKRIKTRRMKKADEEEIHRRGT